MSVFMNFLTLVAVVLAGVFSVKVYAFMKAKIPFLGSWLDKQTALLQQIAVLAVAALMVWAGTFLNLALPESLHLFTDPNTASLLAAAIAYAIHKPKG